MPNNEDSHEAGRIRFSGEFVNGDTQETTELCDVSVVHVGRLIRAMKDGDALVLNAREITTW